MAGSNAKLSILSIVAIVAPRPVLFSNAIEDTWANPAGQFDGAVFDTDVDVVTAKLTALFEGQGDGIGQTLIDRLGGDNGVGRRGVQLQPRWGVRLLGQARCAGEKDHEKRKGQQHSGHRKISFARYAPIVSR